MSDDMLDQRTRHRLEDLQDIVKQDAKLIQNLRREIEKLRDALKPFAKATSGQFADILFGEMPDNSTVTVTLQLGDLRRARDAIEGVTEPMSSKDETEFFVLSEFAPLPESASPWRDIESAPKDGTIIFVWDECSSPGIVAAYYTNDYWVYADQILADVDPEGPIASYWMPMPEPPR